MPVRWALRSTIQRSCPLGSLRNNTKFMSTGLVMQQSEGRGELDAKGCVDQEDGHDARSKESVLHTEVTQEVTKRFRQDYITQEENSS